MIEGIRKAVRTGEVTMSQLAKRAGVSHRTVGNLMQEDWNPTMATVKALEVALEAIREERGVAPITNQERAAG